MGGEYFSLGAGTDIAPLLKGLKDDARQAPHWGYMIAGEVVVTYTDGSADTCKKHDLFDLQLSAELVLGLEDAEVVLFSPEREHTAAMDHMLRATKR